MFLVSFVGLFLKHLLVRLHLSPDLIFSLLENGEDHVVQMVPSLVIVHTQVRSHSLNYGEEGLHAAIDVGGVGVGGGTQDMGHFGFLVFLHKVPNLLVRAEWCDELALLILDLAILEWVNLIFLFFRLLSRGFKFHRLPRAFLSEVSVDAALDGLYLQGLSIVCEALKHDEVLNILKHHRIDAAKGLSSGQPRLFVVFIIAVVVLPDPGPLK